MTNLEERFAAMVDLAKNPNDTKAKEILTSAITEDVPEPIYTDNYQENYMYENHHGLRMISLPIDYTDPDDDTEDEDEDEDYDADAALARMIEMTRKSHEAEHIDYESVANNQLKEYLDSKKEEDEPQGVTESVENSDTVSTATKNKESLETISEHADKAIDHVVESLEQFAETASDAMDALIDNVARDVSEISEVITTGTGDNSIATIDNDNRNRVEEATILLNGKPISIGEEVTV